MEAQGILLSVAVMLSVIVFGKQNVNVTFNFNKQDVIDFTKLLKTDHVQGLRSFFSISGLNLYYF